MLHAFGLKSVSLRQQVARQKTVARVREMATRPTAPCPLGNFLPGHPIPPYKISHLKHGTVTLSHLLEQMPHKNAIFTFLPYSMHEQGIKMLDEFNDKNCLLVPVIYNVTFNKMFLSKRDCHPKDIYRLVYEGSSELQANGFPGSTKDGKFSPHNFTVVAAKDKVLSIRQLPDQAQLKPELMIEEVLKHFNECVTPGVFRPHI